MSTSGYAPDIERLYGEIAEIAAVRDLLKAAACRGVGVNRFFLRRGQGRSAADAAKEVCAGCPARERCRQHGLQERHGIWGGLSERQRRLERLDAGTAAPQAAKVCGWCDNPLRGDGFCDDVCRAAGLRHAAAAPRH